MKSKGVISKIILYFSFLVWLLNGLVAKILNFVPRHQELVATILSTEYARTLIILIGIGELFIALWIISNWKSRLCVWTQISLVLIMNIIELIIAPDLLLFGYFNIVLAILFCIIIYYREYNIKPNA